MVFSVVVFYGLYKKKHLLQICTNQKIRIIFMGFSATKAHTFHSEILASLNFNKNKIVSLDFRTSIQWNVDLAIFQHNNIYQDCWKNTSSILECMVILLSRGQGPDSCWKYRTDLSRSYSSFWNLSPGFENNHTFKCRFGIFPTVLTTIIMLENCQDNILVYGCSPIQGTKFYSCRNLMNPGSQNRTYINSLFYIV